MMQRPDIVKKLQKDFPHLKKEVLKVSVDLIFEEILDALEEHKKVYLTRFGVFDIYSRKGSPPNIKRFKGMPYREITYYPKFRISKKLQRKLNDAVRTNPTHNRG